MQFIRILLGVILLVCSFSSKSSLSSIAFNYSAHPPLERLSAYDVVVISPTVTINPKMYRHANSELFAYISVGEVTTTEDYYHHIKPAWLIGKNQIWQARVLDQTNPAWRTFFIDHVVTPLWNKGYRGFFLDTLDSYNLVANNEAAKQRQITGLVQLIKAIKIKYPTAKLIFNRGFELIPSLKEEVYAVAAESLFASWNEEKHQYEAVSENNRQYLLTQFHSLQQAGIPVISIDYLPREQKQQANTIAKKISALGIIPWITDRYLSTIGQGNIQTLPRKLFAIISRTPNRTLFDPSFQLLLSFPVQYMGYVVEFHDVINPLPTDFNPDEYAGIIVWAAPSNSKDKNNLHTWLVQQLKTHVPIVFFDGFGFDATDKLLAPFGLTTEAVAGHVKSVRITKNDKTVMGYEMQALPISHDFVPLHAAHSDILMQLTTPRGQTEDVVAVTPWGGYALSDFVEMGTPSGDNFWILNPFTWLQRTLRLPTMPVPDVTTENGRRLMFVHIDGDGFSSIAEWRGGKIGAIELKNRILDKYQVPTTFSIIVGELAKNGLYPHQSSELEKAAKDIFALPWIEVASHTFSHPFDWVLVATTTTGKFNLPIPNYHYNAKTEIQGSVNYISKNLAPPNKKTRILLWSGFANPNEEVVAATYDAHVLNMNGYGTDITHAFQSLSAILPIGLRLGPYYQVYAPIANEENYTNTWSGPYYGYQRVIETLELTENPTRYKPIDLYYHIYSALKPAALKALNKVYQWALAQPINPIFASEYAEKAMDLDSASIAKFADGWQINTNGYVREMRVPKTMGYPDLNRSLNVIGFNEHHDTYYVHLGTGTKSILYFSKKVPTVPYLVSANGSIILFKRDNQHHALSFKIKSNLPLIFELANVTHCTVKEKNKKLVSVSKNNDMMTFQLSAKDSDDIQINC